jgi:hypothetical protein
VEAASEQTRPAGEEQVDAERFERLLGDGRAYEGQEDESAGPHLLDRGANDAEDASSQGQQQGEEMTGDRCEWPPDG